ncbi:MAG: hypothetical protein AB1714_23820 [Acidobacteriota bacterium]
MRVGVWGAGSLGSAMVYRLATATFVSELVWINRTLTNIESRCVDIEHGLAFAPCCRSVVACSQVRANAVLTGIELLVLTPGGAVPPGGSRADLYPANARMFRETVLPALRSFSGVVIVITNPVDLMARLVAVETPLPATRVLGLGTVVETARLRASLGGYLRSNPPARTLSAFAIGTHDEWFVPVLPPEWLLGEQMTDAELAGIRDAVRREVVGGAARVKQGQASTIHPIVEGMLSVAEAVAGDSHSVLTVSTLDPEDPDRLFYSVPCRIGREGVVHRDRELATRDPIRSELREGQERMRRQI